MKRRAILLIPLLTLFAFAMTALAQSAGSYTLTWFSIDGGGGNSSGGTYSLGGIIGQPDAGRMSGGSYVITGGYWAASLAAGLTPTSTRTPTRTTTATLTRTTTATRTPTPSTGTAAPTRTQTRTATASPCSVKPSKPVLVKPKNNATTTRVRVKLKWQAATCAQTYTAIVKDALTGKKVYKKTGLIVLVYKTKALTPGNSYKWFIKACNAIGCTRSAKRLFTIQ